MSFTKKDRNVRPGFGNSIPAQEREGRIGSARFAAIVAEALQREFGGTNAAVKIVVGLTQANERAVKNWFSAKNAPGGPHLMSLMRHSDEVFEMLLLLAGRNDLLATKKVADIRQKIRQMLDLLDAIQ